MISSLIFKNSRLLTRPKKLLETIEIDLKTRSSCQTPSCLTSSYQSCNIETMEIYIKTQS